MTQQERLDFAIELVKRLSEKAAKEGKSDAYDKHQQVADLLWYIDTGHKPLGVSGFFHAI